MKSLFLHGIIHFPLLLLICITTHCEAQSTRWKKLLNEKDLSGWDTYLGPSYDSV